MPKKDGVIRVDNYWCHTTIFSRPFAIEKSVDDSEAFRSNEDPRSIGKIAEEGSSQSHRQGKDDRNVEGSRGRKSSGFFGLSVPSPIKEKIDAAAEGIQTLQHRAASVAEDKFHLHLPDVSKLPFRNPFQGQHKDKPIAAAGKSPLDMPGMSYITIFSDDSKVSEHLNELSIVSSSIR